MEESLNEAEANQSFRSPVRRRRSTFFDRRESIVPQPMPENVDPNVCKHNTETNEKYYDELMKYNNKLLLEKEHWKNEVNTRRNKYHDLRQQYTMAVKAPGHSRIPYSALTNEDIEFVNGRANISKLIDLQQKLHNSLKVTREFYRRKNELDDVVLSICENKVNKITDYILENSTIEPQN